jgi:DNA-binding MarR family transcriptional regulator
MSNPRPQIGYLLKQAQSLLRLRMEQALEPLGLTVSHYSCLHHLRQQPGISSAGLARATFVTRQSMGTLLQQLVDRGLVERADQAEGGRALPTVLTTAGAQALDAAQTLVDAVEQRMLAGLDTEAQEALAASLDACIQGLRADRSKPNEG